MSIFFHKGKENILESKKEQGLEQNELKKIQDAFLKVLDNKNLAISIFCIVCKGKISNFKF
jgi:hypothetical protein